VRRGRACEKSSGRGELARIGKWGGVAGLELFLKFLIFFQDLLLTLANLAEQSPIWTEKFPTHPPPTTTLKPANLSGFPIARQLDVFHRPNRPFGLFGRFLGTLSSIRPDTFKNSHTPIINKSTYITKSQGAGERNIS
jgi:hypothetical protein